MACRSSCYYGGMVLYVPSIYLLQSITQMLTLWALQMLVDDRTNCLADATNPPRLSLEGWAVLDLILSKGIDMDIDIRHPDDMRYSSDPNFSQFLLHHVASRSHLEVLKYCLKLGADVHVPTWQRVSQISRVGVYPYRRINGSTGVNWQVLCAHV